MVPNPAEAIEGFRQALARVQPGAARLHVAHRVDTAPHRPPALPFDTCAVSVFSLSNSYGASAPAGRGAVLQVTSAEVNSGSRFQLQHYNARTSPGTLAALLVNAPVLWPQLGIDMLDDTSAGAWIKQNTDRDSFFLGAPHANLLSVLRRYLAGTLRPIFEGE